MKGRSAAFLKKITLSIAFLLFGILSFSANSSNYSEETQVLLEEIEETLKEYKHCSTKLDCQKKEFYFFRRIVGGFEISVYSMTDSRVISDVINHSLNLYNKTGQKINMKIDFYTEKHNETMGLKRLFIEPYILMNLKGNK